jgi:hypothetical protein
VGISQAKKLALPMEIAIVVNVCAAMAGVVQIASCCSVMVFHKLTVRALVMGYVLESTNVSVNLALQAHFVSTLYVKAIVFRGMPVQGMDTVDPQILVIAWMGGLDLSVTSQSVRVAANMVANVWHHIDVSAHLAGQESSVSMPCVMGCLFWMVLVLDMGPVLLLTLQWKKKRLPVHLVYATLASTSLLGVQHPPASLRTLLAAHHAVAMVNVLDMKLVFAILAGLGQVVTLQLVVERPPQKDHAQGTENALDPSLVGVIKDGLDLSAPSQFVIHPVLMEAHVIPLVCASVLMATEVTTVVNPSAMRNLQLKVLVPRMVCVLHIPKVQGVRVQVSGQVNTVKFLDAGV